MVYKKFYIFRLFNFSNQLYIFPSYWSTEINEVIGYSNIVQSFARDTPLRQNFTNFEYSLNSFQWFVPWLNEYFLKLNFY